MVEVIRITSIHMVLYLFRTASCDRPIVDWCSVDCRDVLITPSPLWHAPLFTSPSSSKQHCAMRMAMLLCTVTHGLPFDVGTG
jgi:hypothetical protein